MPLYEYECDACGRFERIRKFSDPPLEACPSCGGRVHKLISSPAIQFKGSGWYITDYARKGTGADQTNGSSVSEAPPKDGAKAGEATQPKEKPTTSSTPSGSATPADSSSKPS